jgi:hypothetical protein
MEIPREQLDVIFYHGAYPLWRHLKDVLNIDIVDVCDRVAKEEPVLTTQLGDKLVARTVHHGEEEEHVMLDPTFNNDVIFLLNSVNVVFKTLQCGVEKNEEKVLADYKFDLNPETNRIRLVHIGTNEPVDGSRSIAVLHLP